MVYKSNSNLSLNTCGKFSSMVLVSEVFFCFVRESGPMISTRKVIAIISAGTTTIKLTCTFCSQCNEITCEHTIFVHELSSSFNMTRGDKDIETRSLKF